MSVRARRAGRKPKRVTKAETIREHKKAHPHKSNKEIAAACDTTANYVSQVLAQPKHQTSRRSTATQLASAAVIEPPQPENPAETDTPPRTRIAHKQLVGLMRKVTNPPNQRNQGWHYNKLVCETSDGADSLVTTRRAADWALSITEYTHESGTFPWGKTFHRFNKDSPWIKDGTPTPAGGHEQPLTDGYAPPYVQASQPDAKTVTNTDTAAKLAALGKYAAAKQCDHDTSTGVHIKRKENGKAVAVATDFHKIAVETIPDDVLPPGVDSVLIPARALKVFAEAHRAVHGKNSVDAVKIGYYAPDPSRNIDNGHYLSFTAGQVRVTAGAYLMDFYNIDRLIYKDYTQAEKLAVCDKSELVSGLKASIKAVNASKKKTKERNDPYCVVLERHGDKTSLTTLGDIGGPYKNKPVVINKTEVPLSQHRQPPDDPRNKVYFNPKILLDGLLSLSSDKIEMSVFSPTGPARIAPQGGPQESIGLVMPINRQPKGRIVFT